MEKELLFEIKPKFVPWIMLFKAMRITLLLFIIVILTYAEIMPIPPDLYIDAVAHIIFWGVLLTIELLIAVFISFKNYEVTSYKIYNNKIEFIEGFINYKYSTVKMKDIREIHYTQNLFQKLAGIGKIRLVTPANIDIRTGMSFIDIENSYEIYRKLKEIHEQAL